MEIRELQQLLLGAVYCHPQSPSFKDTILGFFLLKHQTGCSVSLKICTEFIMFYAVWLYISNHCHCGLFHACSCYKAQVSYVFESFAYL